MRHPWYSLLKRLALPARARRPRRRPPLCLEVLEDRCTPTTPGSLDPSFSFDGKVTTGFGPNTITTGSAVAVQADGKIVAGGLVFTSGVGNDFALARYNPDGSLDTSFDSDGRVTVDFGGNNDAIVDLAIQPDGKIIAVGNTANTAGTAFIALARLNPNGSLDGSFGIGGLDVFSFASEAQAVALQEDGKIVVAGGIVNNGFADFLLARLNTNGVFDTTFGLLGLVNTDFAPIGESADLANEVAIQEDGKIVVAGVTGAGGTTDFALARYTTEGSLDPSFNSTGLVTTDFGNTVDVLQGGIAIQEDGKIVVGGYTVNPFIGNYDFALARYDPNGSLDTTFDGDGRVTTDFDSLLDLATDLVIQSDGKILVGGESGGKADFALARYGPNGSLDTTFDGDGRVTTPFGTTPEASVDIASALALQSNGRVILVGTTNATTTGFNEFALARYLVPPEVTIEDLSVTEGDGVARFTVSLSFAISEPVRISYATADDSAKAGSDYQQTQGTLVIPAGQPDSPPPSRVIEVPIIDDDTDEEAETFFLNLSSPVNAFLIDNQATATIEDNDPTPTLSIDDVSVNEADGTAPFTLSLTNPSSRTITVDFTTMDFGPSPIHATPGMDYTTTSFNVSIDPGSLSKSVSVPILDDTIDENNETFGVRLTNPMNATLGDANGQGTITDNDPPPRLSINDVTVNEGGGTTTFTVTLTGQTEKVVTVAYATANGSATAGNDYTQKSGTLTFNPGTQSVNISVTILDDTIYEGMEQFFVNLTDPNNANIDDAQGLGIINDNEPAPTLTIDDVTVGEGDGIATFTVTLAGDTSTTAAVDFVTVNGSATSGQDFVQTSERLTFDPGIMSRTVTVVIVDDGVDEDDEVFFAELRNPTNAALEDSQGRGTITDNDASPALFINDVVVHEDDGTATFTVSLAGRTEREVSVDFTNASGTTNPATPDVDFVQRQGRLTFNPGVTSGTINVTLIDDNTDEVDETFLVNLSNPVNALLGDNQAEGTIVDNDGPPALSIADVEVPEGGSAIFTVSLSHPSSRTVTVEARTANTTPNASAVGGQDYSPVTTTLTFDPGTLSRNLTVETLDDTTDEDVERFLVDLTNPANATIADGQALGTIDDNDPLPTLSVNDVTVDEVARAATFTVSLTGQTAKVVQVDFVVGVNPGAPSALPGEDFVQTSGTLRFDPGITSRTITVEILDDDIHEEEETFLVNLLSPTNATVDDGSGVGTVTDNDPPSTLTVAADDPLAREKTAGTDNGVFTITRENDLNKALTVNYRLSGTAANGADYATLSGTVELPEGEEVVSVTLVPVDDQSFEGNETVILTLLSSGDYLVGEPKEATVVLRDNELRAEGRDVTPAVGRADPVTVARFVSADSTAPPEQFSATITFEDGSTAEGTITQPDGPGTPFVVMTSRAFPTKSTDLTGTFPVQTRITDTAGGTSVTVEGVATVQEDFPPEVDTPSKRLVFEWFKLLLQRPPTDGELTFLSERLDAGLPPDRAVSMIQASAEYASNLVFRAYHEWLHRDPEPGGFTTWHNALMNQPGFTYRELEVAIILSPEFASQAATAGSDALGLLYARGLNRSIDEAGLSFWGARLFMGTSDLEEVARSVLSSQERGVVILSANPSLERPLLGLYQVIVERNADEDGLGLLADFFTSGADLPAVVRLMATSEEFILENGGLP